ncbi:MAG TPA: methyltransferase domain-containing protein [Pyrinomonadaceae bacterium]|nr:methyltransferase domain-containing protein [Pyrinomonadaceae bacterium]
MSVVAKDFDRLATLDREGWTANNHYHKFLLQHVPKNCRRVLEVGCGTGAFARLLAACAEQVIALDLSPQMIRVARANSAQFANLEFRQADVVEFDLPPAHFDCIASIATLHHVPLRPVLLKLKQALSPGGTLIVLDLFEPERNFVSPSGWRDGFLDLTAMAASVSLRLLYNGRLRPPREVRAAWEEHGRHDTYPTMRDIRAISADLFPGARIKKHLLWRYSIVWESPAK